jgi:hypothetical protein
MDSRGKKRAYCGSEKTTVERRFVIVQPLGGDSFDVAIEGEQAVASVREIKKKIVQEMGIEAYRQELYEVAMPEPGKSVVREDDAEPRLLGLGEEVATGATVMLSVKEPIQWDDKWKGNCIQLSGGNSIATCCTQRRSTHTPPAVKHALAYDEGEGQAVRSKEPLEPYSGVHCFEYVFSRPQEEDENVHLQDGASLGGYYIVGVVRASVPEEKYSEKGASLGFSFTDDNQNGVLGSNAWWGIEDDEDIMIAGEETRRVPEHAKNDYGQAFGAGDKIGFAIDMNKGVMTFFRNGELMDGTAIEGIEIDKPLHLVTSLYNSGASVKLTVPDPMVEW